MIGKKIMQNLRYPIVGWITAVVGILILGWIWPAFFPGINQAAHYGAADTGMGFILGLTILVATPAALIGGLIGSRLPREGGRTEQTLVAALVGMILAFPFACYSLWVFSGY